ncbi:dioxygenase [Microbacterium betulae]|uniref:Dioxygenase n=1 Tax=Microbacterium betulae TaxID=2981139 RepID=A0AA97I5J2_9MICO|nr:dioxygenase [Microbacterium sp. AB]WOF21540.1 dioxygenase [Microbacterium sp. AB]
MATGKNRDDREARQRVRAYEARTRLHDAQVARRKRDNIVSIGAATVIVAAAIGAQALFYSVGPGAPEPAVSPSPSETSAPAPLVTPEGSTPSPAATPAE